MTEMSSGSNAPSPAVNEGRESAQLLSAVPLQREVDELKTKLKEAEKRSEREIKALNQEVRRCVARLRGGGAEDRKSVV